MYFYISDISLLSLLLLIETWIIINTLHYVHFLIFDITVNVNKINSACKCCGCITYMPFGRFSLFWAVYFYNSTRITTTHVRFSAHEIIRLFRYCVMYASNDLHQLLNRLTITFVWIWISSLLVGKQ